MATDTTKACEELLADIKARKFSPLYLLHGEESYFIDLIADALDASVLTEAEKGFNYSLFYGKDLADAAPIAQAARRFPMMANHQLVIVREAQEIKNYDPLISYFQTPLSSTILVLCYKNKKFDKRTKAYTALKKATIFESAKLYSNQVPAWITSYLKKQHMRINDKACMLLSEYTGNDLGRIASELDKLMLNKKDKKEEISLDDIEFYVGISKEFNIFELQNAIGQRNTFKAYQIIEFLSRSKESHLIPLISNLYSFFSKLYVAHQLPDKSKNALMKSLGINFYFADDYLTALKNYSPARVQYAFGVLKTFDLKSKGINSNVTEEKQLLKELLSLITSRD